MSVKDNPQEQNNTNTFPLSYHQERIWFIDEFETANVYASHPTYHNIPMILQLSGCVDESVMQRAIDVLVDRHEILRTVVHARPGDYRQQIEDKVKLPLTVDQVRAESVDEAIDACARLALEPLGLTTAPLARCCLLRWRNESAFLVLILPHLIADRKATRILGGELVALYDGVLTGHSVQMSEPGLQYVDFSEWQRDWPEEAVRESFMHWQYRLRNKPAALELPTDRPRPGMHVFDVGRVCRAVPPATTADIVQYCGNNALAPRALFGAAFATVLHRYSGQKEVYFGTSFDLRDEQTGDLAGPASNLVVLQSSCEGQSLGALLGQQVRESEWAHQHKDLPFDRLVSLLRPEKDMSRTALFDILLSVEDDDEGEWQATGLAAKLIDTNLGYGKYDLHLLVRRQRQSPQFECTLVYNRVIYDAYFAEQLLGHVVRAVGLILKQPDLAIDKVPLLTEAERAFQLAQSGDVVCDYPRELTITQCFTEVAKRFPDRIAVSDNLGHMPYRELERRANQLSHCLLDAGVQAGGLIGVCVSPTVNATVIILAILKTGAAYLPLDPNAPTDRIAFTVADAACPLVLCQSTTRQAVDGLATRILCFDEIALDAAVDTAPEVSVQAKDLAYCIYTSGSTGQPKGVLVEHRNVVRLFFNDTPAFEFSATDVWTVFHNLNFDFSVWELFGALLFGGRAVMVDHAVRADTSAFLDLLEHEEVTVLNQTPSAFYNLDLSYRDGNRRPLALRYIIFGGESLNPMRLYDWTERHPETQLVNMYGITETTVHVSVKYLTAADMANADSNIGRPIPTNGWFILDEHLKPVPTGVAGELYVSGAGVTRGYLNRDELTRERFIDHPFVPGEKLYRTGDRAKFRPDGEVVYLGRLDNQVQVRGFRIELNEITTALLKQPNIVEAVVIATDRYIGTNEILAYLVSAEPIDTAQLRTELVRILPEYMVPAVFVQLEQIPVTPNGKLAEERLPNPGPYRQEGSRYVAPETELQERLVAIWSRHLNAERIGIGSSFFELGGHSLLATRAVADIAESEGVALPIRVFFENATIEHLAHWIEKKGKSADSELEICSVDRDGPVPLSFAQQRVWFIDKLEGGSAQYNMIAPVRLHGNFDLERFRRAAEQLVQRHEVLRAIYVEQGGEPVQVIQPAQAVHIPFMDLKGDSAEVREHIVWEQIQAEVGSTFDLSTDPVLRLSVMQTGPLENVVIVNIHHIAADGVSIEILMRELVQLYDGTEALPPVPLQYADYAVWEKRWLGSDAYRQQLAYWRQSLSGIPQLHNLPLDYPRPAIPSYRGQTLKQVLGGAAPGKLDAWARERGCTQFMLYQAVFSVLLARWSHHNDVVMGTPIAGRFNQSLQSVVGFFANTVVLRNQVNVEDTFDVFLNRVKTVTLEAFEHQLVPFDKLVDELRPSRSLSHNPLFQIAFSAGELNTPENAGNVLQIEPIGIVELPTKFELSLHVSPLTEGTVELEWGYASDLFDRDSIQKLHNAFAALVEQLGTDPARPLSELHCIDPLEAKAMALSAPAPVNPTTHADVIGWFETNVATAPDRIALEQASEQLSYGELDAMANGLARELIKLGIQPDDRVALCLGRQPRLVAAVLACAKVGAVYLPMDPAYPLDRLGFMMDDARAAAALVDDVTEPLLESLEAGAIKRLNVGKVAPAAQAPFAVDQRRKAELSHLIYTSGSTGRPKGVAIRKRSVMALMAWSHRYFSTEECECVLFSTSICFDLSVFEMWLPLCRGGRISLVDNVLALRETDLTPTLVNTVPSLLTTLLDTGTTLPGARAVMLAGEPLSAILVRRAFEQTSVRSVGNLYGPSEDTTYSTAVRFNEPTSTEPSIGKPVDGTTAWVLDEAMHPLPHGAIGELYLAGDGLARGYFDRPELTAERFVPNPFGDGDRLYRTGDLVRICNSELQYLGRVDRQAKLRGFRIELSEVEYALSNHPEVLEARAVVHETTQQLLAAVRIGEGTDAETLTGQLKRHLQSSLPDYMVPAHILALHAFPLLPNGKLDRDTLKQQINTRHAPQYVAPQGNVEQTLASLWASLLDVDQVGRNDNFFDIGGHSLLAVKMLHQVEQTFDISIDVRSVFELRTLGDLASLIELSSQAVTEASDDWETLEL